MSRKSERRARERADEILRAANGRGGDYGSGRLTRAQKKSQEQHIGWTPGPDTVGKKIARKLWG